MNARFTEECRLNHLDFEESERKIERLNIRDGRTEKDLVLPCEKDIYLGMFFDGTNNNKYRDTPGSSQSNVARLYEVFPGTPAQQKAPVFAPKINDDGSKTARPVFPDQAFKPKTIAEEDFPYYRKVYIPGVGTPMPDVGDSGTGMDRTGGLVAARLGEIRLHWAMLQLMNQVHLAIFKSPLVTAVDVRAAWKKKGAHSVLDELPLIVAFGPKMLMETQKLVQKQLNEFENELGIPDESAFADLLVEYESVLKAALVKRGKTKPHIRKIRLSVFGFSRGAAEARAWVNMITDRWGNLLCGIPLQIDFLGIFDTVASVGLAQAMPHFNGHAAWADEQFMPVPGNVKRCVHLVAGLEIRGSFPLDSVCQGGELPANCKEIVYPGVHSDVGGGYPPGDQGRGKADSQKLSQIALAQMYREARMAAVPLVPETAMRASQTEYFRIDSKLRQDFNAYVAATRTGTIPPTNGKGEARFASMYPTETQPREELFRIMRRHYGIWLRWRKSLLKQPGGVSALPNLTQATSDTRFQDIEDFKGAEQELRKELLFLQTSDPGKFDVLDDPLENYLKKINHYSLSTGAAGGIALGPAALALGSLA
ncbi:MAG: DUF2235 domain-containing protein, partial [Burkholderiales bacterium]|nr:DUF2235 domain-containing protein [Burkholderiales bacterium]